jgi:hypothetical protein
LWALCYGEVITRWTFALLIIGVITIGPRVAPLIVPRALGLVPPEPGTAGAEVPIEMVGIDRPFADADRMMLDSVLELPVVESLDLEMPSDTVPASVGLAKGP